MHTGELGLRVGALLFMFMLYGCGGSDDPPPAPAAPAATELVWDEGNWDEVNWD